VNPNRKLCKSLQSVAAYYEHWNTARLNLHDRWGGETEFFALQEQVGFTQKFPRWAVALKYAAEEAPTR